MMLEIVLKLFSECILRRLFVFELVDNAGGSGNKVSKVGIERVVNKGN
jgi:hypothetical protein